MLFGVRLAHCMKKLSVLIGVFRSSCKIIFSKKVDNLTVESDVKKNNFHGSSIGEKQF